MRVLLSEGSSTSAREAITALGLAGHHVELCDPDPYCLGRFSRFVRRYHRCPGLGSDPQGFLTFVLDRLAGGKFDVLLPIHEQGYLFAKVREQILAHTSVALPSFESYARALDKVRFSELLSELNLPQPATRFFQSKDELERFDVFPTVVKASVGTASRGTWMVQDRAGLHQAIAELEADGSFRRPVLVQDVVAGEIEHAQALFCDGRLITSHAYRQIMRGAGGGDAIKLSVEHAVVRSHLARIGAHLGWHGALSVDYIVERETSTPRYIDCNPRLVEPMSAALAGLDLTGLLLRISLGETTETVPDSKAGVRTHIAIQALLGSALRDASRLRLVGEAWRLLVKRGPYAASCEELTPLRLDWLSGIPLTALALLLLASPCASQKLPKRGWGAHLLNLDSIRKIEDLRCAQAPA
jgi:predicted ATP-grasp superfamily ATP-dependent carboligase